MGRYSRKDMIEFAKFAKSYQSSQNVKEAYDAYLNGARLTIPLGFETSLLRTIQRANKVFINGICIKSQYLDNVVEFDFNKLNLLTIDLWDNKKRILHLKTMES